MAITQINTPGAPALAKNPMWYQVTTDNFYTPAVLPYFRLRFNNTGCNAIDQGLTVQVDGETFNFVSVAGSPNTSQFRANLDPLPLNEWVDVFVNDVMANMKFATYFTPSITYPIPGTVEVTFTSKHGHTLSGLAETMSNTALTSSNTNTPASKADNFNLVVELYVREGLKEGNYALVHTYEQVPGLDEKAWINVQPQVKPQLVPYVPAYGLSMGVAKHLGAVREFFIRVAERSGSPATLGSWYYQDGMGLGWLAGDGYVEFPSGGLFLDINSNTKYLTHQPRTKVVYPNQREYLWLWKLSEGEHQLQVSVTAYFTDGTNSPDVKIPATALTLLQQWGIWVIPTGYLTLEVDQVDPTKTVQYYTVQCTYNSINSEVMTYVVDHNGQAPYTELLLMNSLGTYDVLRCDGYRQEQLQGEQEVVDHTLQPGYSAQDAQLKSLRDDHLLTYQVKAGPFTSAELPWVKDLLLRHGQAYVASGEKWVPIILTYSNVELLDEENDLHQVELQYQLAWKVENHSA